MMKLKVFSLLVLIIISTPLIAQFQLSGKVLSEKDSSGIDSCVVYLNQQFTTYSDRNGVFQFQNLPVGNYILQTSFKIKF